MPRMWPTVREVRLLSPSTAVVLCIAVATDRKRFQSCELRQALRHARAAADRGQLAQAASEPWVELVTDKAELQLSKAAQLPNLQSAQQQASGRQAGGCSGGRAGRHGSTRAKAPA